MFFFVQDCFFYSLVFDPVQKTLLADQGEIRVGSKYQAEIPDKLVEGEPGKIRERIGGNRNVITVCYPLRRNGHQGSREARDEALGPQ